MRYTTTVDINLPREKVIELFDSVDNLYKWQPELVSFDHISGEPGEVGSKSKLKYKMNKREVEMIETITIKNLPSEFSGTYEAKGVMNYITNRFEKISDGKTKWISENEFRCSGFMRIMTALMPGAFRKQTQKYLNQFKEFAENSASA